MHGMGSARAEEYVEEYEAPLWDHLVELLERLRKAAIAVVAASVIASFVPARLDPYTPLVIAFTRWLLDQVVPERVSAFGVSVEVSLIQSSPFTGLLVLVKSSLLLGLIIASPIVAWEIYAFLRPALYPHERFILKALGLTSVVFFAMGVIIALKVVLPLGFQFAFLTSAAVFGDKLVAFADVNRILTTTIIAVIGLGLLYESPILLYMLVRYGIVSPDVMSGDKGKLLFIIVLIVAAVVTPDGTGLGMLILALPLYIALRAAAWLGGRSRRQSRI